MSKFNKNIMGRKIKTTIVSNLFIQGMPLNMLVAPLLKKNIKPINIRKKYYNICFLNNHLSLS